MSNSTKRWELGLSQVRPWLWVGAAHAATREQLHNLDIQFVVWCTPEVEPPVLKKDISMLRVTVKDDPNENLGMYFSEVLAAVRSCKVAEGKVVIVCRAGISRSATLAIISVMSEEGIDLRSAYTIVKKGRPIIRPNIGFFKQMIEFESKTQGKMSVIMTTSPYDEKEEVPDIYLEELSMKTSSSFSTYIPL